MGMLLTVGSTRHRFVRVREQWNVRGWKSGAVNLRVGNLGVEKESKKPENKKCRNKRSENI